MSEAVLIRPVVAADQPAWRVLWDGYNAFYGREGPTALPEVVTRTTWARVLQANEPVHALVAVRGTELVGLCQYLFHRSTTWIADVCYLQDLFTAPAARGQGVGGRLIEATCERARSVGCSRVYWQTQQANSTARSLYDRLAQFKGFIVYDRQLQPPG